LSLGKNNIIESLSQKEQNTRGLFFGEISELCFQHKRCKYF
jgi:hypothetical protein